MGSRKSEREGYYVSDLDRVKDVFPEVRRTGCVWLGITFPPVPSHSCHPDPLLGKKTDICEHHSLYVIFQSQVNIPL